MSDQRSAGLFIALGQHLKSAFKWSFPLLSAIQRERIQERRGRGDVIKTAQGFSFCCLKCSLPFLFFNNCFVYINQNGSLWEGEVSREPGNAASLLELSLQSWGPLGHAAVGR